jgi:hypothetical protein
VKNVFPYSWWGEFAMVRTKKLILAHNLAERVLWLDEHMVASSVGPLDAEAVQLAKEFLGCQQP